MKKRIENYIQPALEQIRQRLSNDSQEVNEKYDGYASSLGPTIINSGLKPALSLYTDIKRNERPKRVEILQIISIMLQSGGEPIPAPDEETSLLDYAINPQNAGNEIALRENIMDAIIALKLAFRNFKHV